MSANTEATPEEVAVVRAFVNTLDVDEGSDQLDATDGLERWLVGAGLVPSGTPASGRDLRLAVRLRSAIRAEIEDSHAKAADPRVIEELEAVCADLPLRAVCDGALAPSVGGVRGGLAQVVAAITTSRIKGTWDRLKICPADDCQWAFYDTSRNRSKRWCSMEVCGNRSKVRAHRDRTHA